MRLGAHLSIAGGLHKAVERAAETGCETLQVFLANPRGWALPIASEDDAARFRDARSARAISPVVAHMPYLPNLGSADADIYAKSVASLRVHLELCDRLGIEYLVMHLGKSKQTSEEEAIARMTQAIDELYCRRPRAVRLCLENTAGQGNEIGWDFATLGRIMNSTTAPERLGLCVDTCHAFAAGYDLRDDAAVVAAVAEIDRHVGLERLCVLHLNDSLRELGSRRDRHAHIGEGRLGDEAFRCILAHPRLNALPGILETPQDAPGDVERNLARLRSLLPRRAS